jgi:two-component system NarL family sensor kinase
VTQAAPEPDPGRADLSLAIVRIAALPVIFIGERLVEHPTLQVNPFDYILAGACVYAVIALALNLTSVASRIPRFAYTSLDFIFVCALTYTSGGPFSQLRYAFFVLPLAAAFLYEPRVTALISGVSLLAYAAIALAHPATRGAHDIEFDLTQAVYLSWMGLTAILLSQVLTRRAQRIAQLAADRGRLVAQALEAEDRERKRLSEALHDEAVQSLLAAHQDLDEASSANGSALARAREGVERAIKELRVAIFDLHPYALEHAGLAAALRAVGREQGRRGGYRCRVTVAPEAAGVHDQLIFALSRELLTNAAKHARAHTVSVNVWRAGRRIELEVTDDGRGLDLERRNAALLQGHIGLASSAERVEALGGSFEVRSIPGEGTLVAASLPDSS